MCHTLLVNFKTKFQLLPWQQLILPRLLTYHTTSERSPLSGQRAEHQISGESSRATYSQTMGHKLWDLWRRINKWFTGDRNAYILLQLTGVQFECASVKWKKKTGKTLKDCVKVMCQSSSRRWLMSMQAGLDTYLRLRMIFEVRHLMKKLFLSWAETPQTPSDFICTRKWAHW